MTRLTTAQVRATLERALDYLHPVRLAGRLPEPHVVRAALVDVARRYPAHAAALHKAAALVGDHLTPTTAAALRDRLADALTLTDA